MATIELTIVNSPLLRPREIMFTHSSFRPTCFDNIEEQKNLLEKGIGFFEQQELHFNPEYKHKLEALPFLTDNCMYVTQYVHGKQTGQRPLALLPIRDDIALLTFTLNNLETNNVFDHLDFLIIDDRSHVQAAEQMRALCDRYGQSLLRVDPSEDRFNFSMLNNLGAALAHARGVREIVLWNADLWTPNKETVPELLRRFHSKNIKMAGTKLLFPPREVYQNTRTDFFKKTLLASEGYIPPEKLEAVLQSIAGSVQFGGGAWFKPHVNSNLAPIHYGELLPPDDPRVNIDSVTTHIMGAFTIFNLEWFMQIGGLNPSLAFYFQDPELALRAIEAGHHPYYFGHDIFLYHAWSHSTFSHLAEASLDRAFDLFLFNYLWPHEARVRLLFKPGLARHLGMTGVNLTGSSF